MTNYHDLKKRKIRKSSRTLAIVIHSHRGGMAMQALGLFLLAVGIVASVRSRRYLLMWRSDTKPSLLSSAITQLVGTAGGIYLSLELLFSFLKIPENWWKPSTFAVEPLALISLVLAIIQPFAVQLWLKIRK
jgi:hypothetical protein